MLELMKGFGWRHVPIQHLTALFLLPISMHGPPASAPPVALRSGQVSIHMDSGTTGWANYGAVDSSPGLDVMRTASAPRLT